MTEREQAVHNVLKEGAIYGRDLLRNALTQAGVNLTGDLIKSIDNVSKAITDKYEHEMVFEFKDYMRYKDMSRLNYTGYTNTDAIIKFVKEVGLNNFAYVSGREGSPNQIANAESKIAWAILQNRRQVLTVDQASSRRVYNKTKMLLFNKIARDVRQINGTEAFFEIVKFFEN
jgi:hypothetical protein